jgi:DNA-binding transcriptional ArsR family regulator
MNRRRKVRVPKAAKTPASAVPSQAAVIFAALGDPTRLALVAELADAHPRSISQLAHGSQLTRSLTRQAITKHLRVLEAACIVRCTRAGRERRFQLDPAPIGDVRQYLDRVSQHWDNALARLNSFVEG